MNYTQYFVITYKGKESVKVYVCARVCFKSLRLSDSLRPPQTAAHQAPLLVGFSRQEHWSGLAFPPPGDLPDPEIRPTSHVSCTGRQILYH